MPSKAIRTKVVNNTQKNRFEVESGGQVSVLEYTLQGDKIFLTHTEVPPALENQGLGSNLAHAAMEYARRSGLKVVPICSFIQKYLEAHPEYSSLSQS